MKRKIAPFYFRRMTTNKFEEIIRYLMGIITVAAIVKLLAVVVKGVVK